MLKKIIIYVFLLGSITTGFSQDKTNPIVFGEIFGGITGGSVGRWAGGFDLNYQFKENLVTARYTGLLGLKRVAVPVTPFTFFPVYYKVDSIDEYAAMIGKRKVYYNQSFSYSVGISYLNREYLVENEDNSYYAEDNYLGIPFELNIKWFKPKKRRYGIYYGIIPIGKPTAIGHSFGFKLLGNVSKKSFVGIGISYGIGWHKTY